MTAAFEAIFTAEAEVTHADGTTQASNAAITKED